MLADLILEANESGWLVSNLFQLDDGSWQANLRTSSHHTDFGRGLDPVSALAAAIEQISQAEPTPEVRQTCEIVDDSPKIDFAGLMAKIQPRSGLSRRFE